MVEVASRCHQKRGVLKRIQISSWQISLFFAIFGKSRVSLLREVREVFRVKIAKADDRDSANLAVVFVALLWVTGKNFSDLAVRLHLNPRMRFFDNFSGFLAGDSDIVLENFFPLIRLDVVVGRIIV